MVADHYRKLGFDTGRETGPTARPTWRLDLDALSPSPSLPMTIEDRALLAPERGVSDREGGPAAAPCWRADPRTARGGRRGARRLARARRLSAQELPGSARRRSWTPPRRRPKRSCKLIAGEEARFAADYRWTCDQLREEELFFHREGRYRLSTFAEANAEVYSDRAYMAPLRRTACCSPRCCGSTTSPPSRCSWSGSLGGAAAPFDYLEVGPGHGLMVCLRRPIAAVRGRWKPGT